MKIILAPDFFKGSLSSFQCITLLKQAAQKVFDSCELIELPIADGGEGTLEAVIDTVGGTYRTIKVQDPLGKIIEARYGTSEEMALIEMAAASGLTLIPIQERNPLYTTSFGTGELIRDALDGGYRKICIAIGGSATNDGGMGAMSALGVRFLDRHNQVLEGIGCHLGKIDRIDLTGMHPAVQETEFKVMCDVSNCLLGTKGAAYTFGAQKGAGEETLKLLENGMQHYAKKVNGQLGIKLEEIKGGGAAGGLGAALYAFLGATMQSGIDTILELVHFSELLEGTDLVVTGEGMVDYQTAYGKTISGIARQSRARNIPVVVIAGSIGEGADALYGQGVTSMTAAVTSPMSLNQAMEHAEEYFTQAADRMFRMIQIGNQ